MQSDVIGSLAKLLAELQVPISLPNALTPSVRETYVVVRQSLDLFGWMTAEEIAERLQERLQARSKS